MSEMQSYDEQKAEIRRKAVTTATGWAPLPMELTGSDWVGQLEAALCTVKGLREARPTRDGTEWAMRAGAQECLEWLVRNERGRCPNEKLRDAEPLTGVSATDSKHEN